MDANNITTTIMSKFIRNNLYDDFADEIREALNTRKRILVKAPTGTGKTCLMKRLAAEYNAVILVPMKDMLGLYACDGISEITKDNYNEYNPFKPCVMIWDTAVLLRNSGICGRVWFIDESHALFDDRRYRESAVEIMRMTRSVEKLLCVSATPSGEVEELGLHLLEYCVSRGNILTHIATTAKPMAYMNELINRAYMNGRKCVVLSDEYASSLWALQYYEENHDSVQLLHSSLRETDAYTNTLKDGEFLARTTICTRVVEMGLNFMNTKTMRVIVHINLGEHTANRIIQFVGRLRKCSNIELIVVVDERRRISIEQKARDSSIIDKVADNTIVLKDDVKDRISGYYDAMSDDKIFALARINAYIREHSSLDAIRQDLLSEGYFTFVDGEDISEWTLEHKTTTRSEDDFAAMMEKEIWDENELDMNQRRWLEEYRSMKKDGFNLREFMLHGFTKSKRIDNIIADAHTIIRVGMFFNNHEGFETEFDYKKLKGINPKLSDDGYSKLRRIFNRCWKYYSIMKQCGSVDEYYTACINGAVAKNKMSVERKSAGGRKGGKRNAAKPICIRNKHNGNVMTFDSRERAAEWMGCPRRTFARFLNGCVTKYNKDYEVLTDE